MNITQLEQKRRATERQIEQLSAPARALEAAEAERSAIEQQIADARQQEQRAAVLARLVELASAGAAALQEIQQAQADFDACVSPLLEAYSAAKQRQIAARSQFYQELATLAPEARNLRADQTAPAAILAELEQGGTDLGAILTDLSGHDRPLDRAYSVGPHTYPGALATALREAYVHQGGHLGPPQPAVRPVVAPVDFRI